jgi:integrase
VADRQEKGYANSNTTKKRGGRTFRYADITEVRAAIKGLWLRHEALEKADILTPLVFCQQKGQRIVRFWRRWKTACAGAGCPGAGCPGLIPHDFRRTAVRNLNRAGVPETVALKITGHKTRSVFDRYDITSEQDLAEASRKLQALAGTISGTNARDLRSGACGATR